MQLCWSIFAEEPDAVGGDIALQTFDGLNRRPEGFELNVSWATGRCFRLARRLRLSYNRRDLRGQEPALHRLVQRDSCNEINAAYSADTLDSVRASPLTGGYRTQPTVFLNPWRRARMCEGS